MERPMNTASKDRVFHKTVQEYIRTLDKPRTPISRVKTVKAKDGSVNVVMHSSRPNTLRSESGDIASTIKEQIGGDRTVNIEIIAEARAVAKFVRVSPRKARLVIDAIKGKRVSEALSVLNYVRKLAAEPIIKVLASAAANAQDGWGAIPEELKIANFIADGGPTLKACPAARPRPCLPHPQAHQPPHRYPDRHACPCSAQASSRGAASQASARPLPPHLALRLPLRPLPQRQPSL